MQRTIRLLLEPSPEQAATLTETCRQFTAAFNAVCAAGWLALLSNSVKLHHQTYYPLKQQFPNGARNIAAKYRAEGGKTALGGLRVNQPIVSNPSPPRSG